MTSYAGWEEILEQGEKILWQGQPDQGLHLRIVNIALFLFGLAFAGFALMWMILASFAGGFFWVFGLLHFSVGAGLSYGALYFDRYRRRHTWYTLTSSRAIISKHMRFSGKSLTSYPINAGTTLEYIDAKIPSIFFATAYKPWNKNRKIQKIGFEFIEEARDVHAKMRSIQTGAVK
jgi:hypothetical protein